VREPERVGKIINNRRICHSMKAPQKTKTDVNIKKGSVKKPPQPSQREVIASLKTAVRNLTGLSPNRKVESCHILAFCSILLGNMAIVLLEENEKGD
jgi:hypothetical protein